MATVVLPVAGMKCASCAGRVERALQGVPEVTSVAVNLMMANATITGPVARAGDMIHAVEQLGFRVPVRSGRFVVSGLSCASCVMRSEQALGQLPGVRKATIQLATHEAVVEYVPGMVETADLQRVMQEMGYELVMPPAADGPDGGVSLLDFAEQERQQEQQQLRLRVMIGALLLVPEWVLMHWSGPFTPATALLIQFACATPIQWWVGWSFHRHAWRAARHGMVNMHTLVSLGSTAAYLYSVVLMLTQWGHAGHHVLYFDSSASIIVLVLVGRFLELRAKGKTSQAIRHLLQLTPETACRVGQTEQIIPVAQVVVGDQLRVRPGERVPVDGRVVTGESTLDESMLTGESVPVARGPGMDVIGGSINQDGVLLVEATRVGQDTALARIVQLVRQAQGARPPIARLADRVAAVFVPAVLGIATLTGLTWWLAGPEPAATHAIMNAIAVLVIACPCALGLATPTSVMVGIGRGADLGILIRGGDVLESAHRVDTVVFDKTGTLTHGTPVLTDWTGNDADLGLVAAVEHGANHPLARAIVRAAEQRGCRLSPVQGFRNVPGRGVAGEVDGHGVQVGTLRFLREQGLVPDGLAGLQPVIEALEQAGRSVMLAAVDGRLAGVLAVADTLRPESPAAVAALRQRGLSLVLLTGDNRLTAEVIARQLGITEVHAGVLPGDKAAVIADLQRRGHRVAMVGDGINDAPALMQADVGMAIGSGAAIAMESAQVTLMTGNPQAVVTAIDLSRATMRNIRQNLFWAFAYNVLLIPLAAGVWYPWFGLLLSPPFAAAAMGLSSVTVVSNALRLRRFVPESNLSEPRCPGLGGWASGL
jgi:Cu+-exporting ATPase